MHGLGAEGLLLSPGDLVWHCDSMVCKGVWRPAFSGDGREAVPVSLLVLWPGPSGGHILRFSEEDAKTQKDYRLPIPQIYIC